MTADAGATAWLTPRLAEFVVAVTGAADEAGAARSALDWATAALDAEVAMVTEAGAVLAWVGFPSTTPPEAVEAVAGTVAAGAHVIDIPGAGRCRVQSTGNLTGMGVDLVVARVGTEPFTRDQARLLRAAAQSLTTTLRPFRALATERVMRAELQQRQTLMERLAVIQNGITRSVPLADLLGSITHAARELLTTDIRMAGILDLRPVVEGIETEAQAALVTRMGTVLGQGYHLGRPQEAKRIARMLAAADRPPAHLAPAG